MAFNDLVLAHILNQMEPAIVLRSCASVSRQWHRVAHACRHVAVHVIEHHAHFESEMSSHSHQPLLDLPRARAWSASGRVKFLAGALLRVEWDDLADRPWSVDAESREAAFIPDALRVLGRLFLVAATVRDADLLARLVDAGAIKAISFFLRARYFNPNGTSDFNLVDNKAIRASAWCLANIAALADGRAMLVRADVHDVLLDMFAMAVKTRVQMIAELCALAIANLYCDAGLRVMALSRFGRVAEVIALTLDGVFDGAFEARDISYHACRAVRELVGKVDAKLINASLDTIVGSRLLERMAELVDMRVGERASSMVLAVLSEIGRSAVRPTLAISLLQPKFADLITHLCNTYARTDTELSYSSSICLAQMALSRDFVAALTQPQIAALGRLGSNLLYRWSSNFMAIRQFDVSLRLTMAVLHIFAQLPDRTELRVAALEQPVRELPAELQIRQILVLAGNLVLRKVTAKQCKTALNRFAQIVSSNRSAVGLSPVNLAQFVQQRSTWVDTADVFGFENALMFDANAFDSLENVTRANEWIGMRLQVNDNDLTVPFTVQAVFRAAGLVAMRSGRRFADQNALQQFLTEELCPLANEGVIAYPFAMSAVLDAVVARVLKTKKK